MASVPAYAPAGKLPSGLGGNESVTD